jgi:hypothetical protein
MKLIRNKEIIGNDPSKDHGGRQELGIEKHTPTMKIACGLFISYVQNGECSPFWLCGTLGLN